MNIERINDGRYRLQLDDASNLIDIEVVHCISPECDCRDIALECTEQSEPPGKLGIDTEIDGWTLRGVRPDLPEARKMARRILDALPYETRRRIFLHFESKYEKRRLEEYRIPPDHVRSGALVSHLDITMGGQNVPGRWDVHFGEFKVEGRTFLADVRFCPNPACDCREVYPVFVEVEHNQEPTARLQDRLMLKWPFDGHPEVFLNDDLTQESVDLLIAAWLAKHADGLPRWKEMYTDIKEVGKRSLAAERPPAPSRAAKPGRNDPCPCGSGKKYKKCCGG